MASVNLSLIAGAGAQFFDNNGVPLAGGLLYTYASGTTTPAVTYTTNAGTVANSNPIVLDASGRVTNEIWLVTGNTYKFVLQTSLAVQIWSFDNIPGANDSSVFLTQLASTTTFGSTGSDLVGFKQANSSGFYTNAVALTVAKKLEQTVSVQDFGGDPTGATDSSGAWAAAMASGARFIDATNATWLINSSITIPGYTSIDIRGATITANTGSTPLFIFNNNEGIEIIGGGGLIQGTAGSFLKCNGSTNQPSSVGNYARQIRLIGIHVTSTTINLFLDMENAVRQVFIDDCMSYTVNGILSNGANVEVFITNSLFYGSTGASGTYGIKLRSPGGTSYFNQGFAVNNCTLDNFNNTFDISDVFVFQVNNCYIGCISSGNTFSFTYAANTTKTEAIMVGAGTVLYGPVVFNNSSGGSNYRTSFNNFEIYVNASSGSGFTIGNNSSNITISNGRFIGSSSNIGIVTTSGNNNCLFSNLQFDNNFSSGIIINDSTGSGYGINNITYQGTGNDFYSNTGPALIANLPVYNSTIASYKQSFVQAQGTFATGSNISSITSSFAAGETGDVVIALACTGMNASTQLFTVNPPTGMVLPSGSGWSSAFIYTSTASGYITVRIPYYITTAISSGTLSITNTTGNSVTTNYHSYFGFERNW